MEINDIIKLSDGSRGRILTTPSGFLSNGAYEVMVGKKRVWVNEDQIMYVINTEFEDNISNYFEIIYDDDGVQMIPKNIEVINVIDGDEELKSIEFITGGGEKHSKITFHIGSTDVWTSKNPKPEPKKKTKKHNLL